MARFYPSTAPPTSPSSELKVRRALSALSDDWSIFHSIAWQSLRSGREGDGEADFVLLHRSYGLIVLEVKGGRIELIDGIWFSIDRDDITHRIKNPFEQATHSKHALLRYFDDVAPDLRVPTCHGVVLPDVTVATRLGPAASPDITIDGSGLPNITEAIGRIAPLEASCGPF